MAETSTMNRVQTALLLVLDSLLGAVIGSLNFVGGMFLVTAVHGTRPSALAKAPLAAVTLFTPRALWITLPCLVSTLLLAPFLVRRLEAIADRPRPYVGAALCGIGFAVVATFPTCILFVAGTVFSQPVTSPADLFVKLAGAGLVGIMSGVGFVFACFPFYAVSGPLFGMLNLGLIRAMAATRAHRPAVRTQP